jgi:hypothetical protein
MQRRRIFRRTRGAALGAANPTQTCISDAVSVGRCRALILAPTSRASGVRQLPSAYIPGFNGVRKARECGSESRMWTESTSISPLSTIAFCQGKGREFERRVPLHSLSRPPSPRPVTASLGCYGPRLGPIHGSPRHRAVHLRITMAAESVFRATELTDITAPSRQNSRHLRPEWTPVWSAWIPVWSALSPVEIGGK